MTDTLSRPKWEMADVLRKFGDSYQKSRHVPFKHLKVVRNIVNCRTAMLGGHMEQCDSCDFERPVYNSCRDRHCPKCQTMTKEKWLEARRADLLPVEYFHQVFTVPHDLNGLILTNKKVMLDLLFKAASKTLLQFGEDPRSRLGGKIGFTLILHTWNQQLFDHFHLHCVIPAGALSADGNWIHPKNSGFLFSVLAMAKVFRGKYLDLIERAYHRGELIFVGKQSHIKNPVLFKSLLDGLRIKKWVVYSKAPFGGPHQVLDYLGRYTHRIAISNNRISDITESSVSFKYRNRSTNEAKTSTVSGQEFLRRFMLHVLPSGFVRIRHYGFLAGRNKRKCLEQCRASLNAKAPENRAKNLNAVEILKQIIGIDVSKCPKCKKGKMNQQGLIKQYFDSS
ncbi:MAG: IS91 family transposase [Bdellovibrionales bacterium CG12_big_fil_rev_8_21_14_0_65_38_15]|nr:MAG: IS91 family transposase [Bdellovibrionales bacterium CG12_big_fil_rev_8_21_14_0_65_38_15]